MKFFFQKKNSIYYINDFRELKRDFRIRQTTSTFNTTC